MFLNDHTRRAHVKPFLATMFLFCAQTECFVIFCLFNMNLMIINTFNAETAYHS